jgi:hypothetical protein
VKILIATPAYGAVVTSAYHESVLTTVSFFKQDFPGIEIESRLVSLSMITTARNLFASQVLADESITHLLFIDADMGFPPSLVARMLALRKPVVGVIYPQRQLDYEAYHRARALTDSVPLAKVIANGYVSGDKSVKSETAADGKATITVRDGFVPVTHTGTGIMLIERQVLEAMRGHYPELWIAEPPPHVRALGLPQGGYLQCFEQARDQYGVTIGEDTSFCLRWTQQMGGEIWANVDEIITHVGSATFSGHYLSKLRHSGVTLDIVETRSDD